jgi:hypothetical protein
VEATWKPWNSSNGSISFEHIVKSATPDFACEIGLERITKGRLSAEQRPARIGLPTLSQWAVIHTNRVDALGYARDIPGLRPWTGFRR